VTDHREFDIIVFGATGFVGKLTADYLARHAPDGVAIALAGRSQARLEGVRSEVGGRAGDWPLVIADSTDAAAMQSLAERARVVATTVGPYRQYGLPLVEACANAGTDYVDLTGEVLFIRETIDRFHKAAQASGARIVHSCGFDSIPSDLGVFLLHQAASADEAGDLEETTYAVIALKGRPSGGTIASMKGMIDDVRADPELRRVAEHPYALSPERAAEPDLGPESDVRSPVHDPALGTWLAPFVMAAINTRVVRRSNALLDWAYGRRFRYREVMATGPGITGRAKALALAGGIGALVGAIGFRPSRALLDRFLPAPGEGPSERARARGFFTIDIHTRTSTGRHYVCHVAAPGDPGYAATSVMLGESALCLALDRERLPPRAGILTPATAMGTALADRLRHAGQTYEVEVTSS
jgi:short subunit dehydrogenase-like uncharacterized protein